MAVVVLVALLALLAERLLRVVELVAAWHGSALAVIEMLAYLVPHYLALALPAAFFLGVFATFSRLGRDGELPAIMSFGCGLHQLLGPIWGLALALVAIETVLVGTVEPLARYAYRARVYEVRNAPFNQLLTERTFLTRGRATLMADEVAPGGEEMSRVFLYTETADGTSIAGTARGGKVDPEIGNETPKLRLRDGLYQMVLPAPAPETRPAPVAATRFRTFAIGTERTPRAFHPRGKDERELTLTELWRARDAPPAPLAKGAVVAELHGQMVRIATILVLPLLAIPLALGRRRPQRSYGIIVGITVLVAYKEIVQLGERLTAAGWVGPEIGLWLPFAGFALASGALFARAAFTVPRPGRVAVAERALERLEPLLARVWPARP